MMTHSRSSVQARNEAYQTVRTVLLRVRTGLQRRQPYRPEEISAKMRELDVALEALDELNRLTIVEQPTLFEKPKYK